MYRIYGYNEDGDIQEELASPTEYVEAVQIAKALMYYHRNVKEIKSQRNKKPFEWFDITECYNIESDFGQVIQEYTTKYPEGIIVQQHKLRKGKLSEEDKYAK